VALSNSRLLRVSDEGVTFSYKDYRQRGKQKEMTLTAVEFSRRLLRHVLPGGFVRVRHYGLLANRCREQKLRLCRRRRLAFPARLAAQGAALPQEEGQRPRRCPQCGQGVLEVVALLPRPREAEAVELDSS
jgi:Putative transposase